MKTTSNRWREYAAAEIPGSLDPFPVFFEYFKTDDLILDLGCGYGRICRDLSELGFRKLIGLDFNIQGLGRGRLEAPRANPPRYCAGNALSLPFRDAVFTGAIMQAFLTTLVDRADREKALDEIFRVLGPSGLMYAAVFGQTWENPIYRKRYEEGLAQGLEKGTFEAVDPRTGRFEYRARHFTREELETLFNRCGFYFLAHQTATFTTRTGNRINGHVIVAGKKSQTAPTRA
ncbi:MAG: class I SAM-dependent methyltransferase [Pseudomonadota bacterium]